LTRFNAITLLRTIKIYVLLQGILDTWAVNDTGPRIEFSLLPGCRKKNAPLRPARRQEF